MGNIGEAELGLGGPGLLRRILQYVLRERKRLDEQLHLFRYVHFWEYFRCGFECDSTRLWSRPR